jgi:hypothetical protein
MSPAASAWEASCVLGPRALDKKVSKTLSNTQWIRFMTPPSFGRPPARHDRFPWIVSRAEHVQ